MLGKGPTVEVIIKARDLAAKVIKGFERNIKVIGQAAMVAAKAIAAIGAAAIGATVGLVKLGERGEKVEGVRRTFERMNGDLALLRKSAKGTTSDFELMTRQNQAMALGAARSNEQFAKMVEISRALGKAQGVDATMALESLTTGIGRQSKLFLDNLGILVDVEGAQKKYAASLVGGARALTDLEKREAFRIEALTKGEELVKKLTGGTLEGAEGASRMAVAWQNLGDKIASVVAESPLVGAFMDQVAGIMSDVVDLLSGDADTLVEGMKVIGKMAGDAFMLGVNSALENLPRNTSFDRFFLRLLPGPLRRGMENLDLQGRVFGSSSETAAGALLADRQELAGIAARARAKAQARKGIPMLPGVSMPGGGGGGGGGSLARGRPLSGTEAELRGLLDAIQKTDAALKGARLDAQFAMPGEKAEAAAKKVADLAAELTNLEAIARRFGGKEGLILATSGISPVAAGLLSPQTIEDPNAQYRKKRYSLAPALSLPGAERGLPFGDTLHPTVASPLDNAEARFQQTAGIVAGTMGDMAAAVIRGTGSVEASVMSMIGGILERTVKNPLLGGVLGGVFAIGAALFSRSERPRVIVDDYGSAAERKMREAMKRPIRITNIIESGGRPIAEIEREMYDRQDRDEVIRFPPGGSLR